MSEIKIAIQQMGAFFQERREQMGRTRQELAAFVGVSANTIERIEFGLFAWDMDLHLRLCQALEIKPYFSAAQPPWAHEGKDRTEDDPERYHGFYISENLPLYPDQLAIIKLTHPRLFLSFTYGANYFADYEDWKANHTDVQWLDPEDKSASETDFESILTDCWNFLALHEREEERLADEMEDDEWEIDENE